MMRLLALAILMITLLAPGRVLGDCFGDWGVPDWYLSTAARTYVGPEFVSIMVVPDGSGDSLEMAFLPDGTYENGVVTLTMVCGDGLAEANYPREDLAIDAADGGLAFCTEGNLPDSDTNASGVTEFRGPFYGGGASLGLMVVMINGVALTSSAGVAVLANSPDLDGNLVVDLSDVVIFAGDFFGAYRYRSDFHFDGVTNLSDVSRMAQAMGASCQ